MLEKVQNTSVLNLRNLLASGLSAVASLIIGLRKARNKQTVTDSAPQKKKKKKVRLTLDIWHSGMLLVLK